MNCYKFKYLKQDKTGNKQLNINDIWNNCIQKSMKAKLYIIDNQCL